MITHPAYLSDDEAARDQRRVKDVVQSFIEQYEREHEASKRSSKKVGVTENFVVEYDSYSGLILVYEKHETVECPFKPGFSKNEIDDIVKLLVMGKQVT